MLGIIRARNGKTSLKAQQAQMKTQQEESQLQQAQIDQLARQLREVRAGLKLSGRANAEVHTVKADVSVAHK